MERRDLSLPFVIRQHNEATVKGLLQLTCVHSGESFRFYEK